jgi:hypothetical protein
LPSFRSRPALSGLAALAGLVLFAYAVRRAGGFGDVMAGVGRVGWGLIPILAVAGLRFALRAECWRRCMPPDTRMPFRRAFTAYLSGDAIGNLTPLGLAASEPTKVFLIRHQLATREAASSLAVDLLVYALSAVAMIVTGVVVLLATVPVPPVWRQALVAAVAGVAVAVPVALRLLGGTWVETRGPRPAWRGRLAALRESIVQSSAGGHPSRLWGVFLLHLVFHALAVVEVWLTIGWLQGAWPTLAQAVIFSALDRAVIVAFKFVPFRIGVDEASSGALATLLGFPGVTGVTLAVVKKVRSLVWTGVGLLLIAAYPAREGPETDRPGTAPAHRT